ncbi:hypothetical protein C8Q76DRAFT_803202 [Earliella scabrosa]|nr:hypothetical protein C8Q76DRAFT_803202 [Earliella scabrosa]
MTDKVNVSFESLTPTPVTLAKPASVLLDPNDENIAVLALQPSTDSPDPSDRTGKVRAIDSDFEGAAVTTPTYPVQVPHVFIFLKRAFGSSYRPPSSGTRAEPTSEEIAANNEMLASIGYWVDDTYNTGSSTDTEDELPLASASSQTPTTGPPQLANGQARPAAGAAVL